MSNAGISSTQDYKVLRPEAVEAAFDYLNTKSEEIGIARANEKRGQYLIEKAERKAKQVFAKLFIKAEGSVDQRKMWATCHADYIAAQALIDEAQEKHAIALQTWENMADSRNRASMIIDAWRTSEASGRQIRSIR